MKKLYLFALLFISTPTFLLGNSSYELILKLDEGGSGTETIKCNAEIIIDFDSCVGLNIITLPFNVSKGCDIIVEPESNNKDIWVNRIENSNHSNSIIVNCNQRKSHLKISFTSLQLPIKRTASNESGQYIAIEPFSKKLLDANISIVELSRVEIVGSAISYIEPQSIVRGNEKNGNSYIIEPNKNKTTGNIVIYLKEVKDSSIFYFALILLGIFIGITTVPSFINSLKSGITFLIISILGLIILNLFFWNGLDEEQRFYDTTTIIAFGTVFGILITVFFKSIYEIYKNVPSRPIAQERLININENVLVIDDENENEEEDEENQEENGD